MPFNPKVPFYQDIPHRRSGRREFPATTKRPFAPFRLAEGIVLHAGDGRRAKIEGNDFLRRA
jgi:hypothetical protein